MQISLFSTNKNKRINLLILLNQNLPMRVEIDYDFDQILLLNLYNLFWKLVCVEN